MGTWSRRPCRHPFASIPRPTRARKMLSRLHSSKAPCPWIGATRLMERRRIGNLRVVGNQTAKEKGRREERLQTFLHRLAWNRTRPFEDPWWIPSLSPHPSRSLRSSTLQATCRELSSAEVPVCARDRFSSRESEACDGQQKKK